MHCAVDLRGGKLIVEQRDSSSDDAG